MIITIFFPPGMDKWACVDWMQANPGVSGWLTLKKRKGGGMVAVAYKLIRPGSPL